MIPYASHAISDADERALLRVLRSGRLAQGPEAVRFEEALADGIGVRYAIAVSSGTAALHVALAALGVGPGDEVIVPSMTFVATSNAVLFCGATPVFADVDPVTLTLSAEDVAKRVSPQTRGVIPMHYGGHPADVDAIREAVGAGRFVLEDACHALGGELRGNPVGSLGDASCFSFHPAKHVATGEGGAVLTDSPDVARRARRFREHGIEREPAYFRGLGLPRTLLDEEGAPWLYEMQELSTNYRLPELSAALGVSQYERIDASIERRDAIARIYASELSDLVEVELPTVGSEVRSAWHLYVVRLRKDRLRCTRRELFEKLHRRGIGVQVHYIPVHLHPYYRERLGTRYGMLPVTESEYLRLLTLPLYPSLTDEQVARVADTLRQEVRRNRR